MERKVQKYTVRDLILGAREEYLKEMEELDKLRDLVEPLSGFTSDVEFKLKGSIISSDLVCDVVKKYTILDKLLRRKGNRKLYSYSLLSCGVIPYIQKDVEKFEDIKANIIESEYFNNMGSVMKFSDKSNRYLLQTTVEDIRLTQLSKKANGQKEILFKDGDSLYLGKNTEIADAFNMLNAQLPAESMPEYQVRLMDSVEDPFALRVVDARKADTIEKTNNIVVLAKRM